MAIAALDAELAAERCPTCRTPTDDGWIRCPRCGTTLRVPCPRCDRLVDPAWSICPWCVAELPAQMMHAQPEAIRDRLAGQGGWGVVSSSLFDVAASQTARYAWERALAWWGMTARLAEASGV